MAKVHISSGTLVSHKRLKKEDKPFSKHNDKIEFVYFPNDTLESFEANLNEFKGNSSKLFYFKKKLSSYILSTFTVLIVLFALLSSSMYEDVFKKIILEVPFSLERADFISLFFTLIFFLGLVIMPSIVDGESSKLKEHLQSWFNKRTRILKRIKLSLESIDKQKTLDCYNVDLENDTHWVWNIALKSMLSHFDKITLHVRNDQKDIVKVNLEKLKVKEILIEALQKETSFIKPVELILSTKEKNLLTLLQLSSTHFIQESDTKLVSLELFEYCGDSFINTKNSSTELISGFQNFIHRSFDDFHFLTQHNSQQILLSKQLVFKELEDEKRRLSYYLRNHIEECLRLFEKPISLLILYYYVKDIVLDEKRLLAILEKLIYSIQQTQQYELISEYWFIIAGEMFDPTNIENFEQTNNSIYRKLSIESLDTLMFLFERNGYFNQALLLAQYLYEINPNKYAINICSLYERSGQFDKAYESLPVDFTSNLIEKKPTEIEVKYLQRKSWIIVSQRRIEQKKEGMNCIVKLEKLLFSHIANNEPLWLWHFYNIKANYEEWNKNYENAINFYKKCLSIPTLGAFEYGATFVNMAIAYRFKFTASEFNDKKAIDKAISLGAIGVKLKESVGDRDEMPVVLHNQALAILYKIAHQTSQTDSINKIKQLTTEALEILDNTGSIKKLGIILCENIIAKELLQEDNTKEIDRLEKHWVNMPSYEKEQTLMLYNIFKQHQCKELNLTLK